MDHETRKHIWWDGCKGQGCGLAELLRGRRGGGRGGLVALKEQAVDVRQDGQLGEEVGVRVRGKGAGLEGSGGDIEVVVPEGEKVQCLMPAA